MTPQAAEARVLIAEKLLGWRWKRDPSVKGEAAKYLDTHYWYDSSGQQHMGLPDLTSDRYTATLLKAMRASDPHLSLSASPNRWECSWSFNGRHYRESGDTPHEAVVKCAVEGLRALRTEGGGSSATEKLVMPRGMSHEERGQRRLFPTVALEDELGHRLQVNHSPEVDSCEVWVRVEGFSFYPGTENEVRRVAAALSAWADRTRAGMRPEADDG